MWPFHLRETFGGSYSISRFHAFVFCLIPSTSTGQSPLLPSPPTTLSSLVPTNPQPPTLITCPISYVRNKWLQNGEEATVEGWASFWKATLLFFYTYISNGRSLAPPLGRKMKLIPSLCLSFSLSLLWKLWSCGEKRSFHHFRPNDDHYCHFGLISRAGFPLLL